MPRAVIVGGTGAIGSACARRLTAAGWEVVVTGRDPSHFPQELRARGIGFTVCDRSDGPGLAPIVGAGADLLVDCMCKTAADARQLVAAMGSLGSTVMISSRAVYVDGQGRHMNSDAPPRFDGPIRESQATLRPDGSPPGTREGYGPNKVAAEQVLLDSGHPVTVLRPSKVHGPWSRRPREWVFVKRVLDGRRHVLLAGRGAGADHNSAAVNIAALVATLTALPPARRLLNIADPDVPRALDIARLVAAHLGHSWQEQLLDDSARPVGQTPWDLFPAVVLDTSAALELGYEPAGTYAETVIEEIDWLVGAHRVGPRAWPLPDQSDPFFQPFFDYGAEDRLLAELSQR